MANAKPVTKVQPTVTGKPNVLVAVTCPICKARTLREEGAGCPEGCKPAKKKTETKEVADQE